MNFTASPNTGLPARLLAERIGGYFARHPEVSRQQFLLDAVQRELALRESAPPAAAVRMPPPSDEDLRIHAWLSERLAAVHHERHGLWPRLRRLLFGRPRARRAAGR